MRRHALAHRVLALLFILAYSASISATAEETALGLSFEEVTPGVWAATQPAESRFNDSNSVVIVTDRDVLVVDAQADPKTVNALIQKIGELTEKPVRYLVNTHFHSDHTQGNYLYRETFPDLEIVSHPSLLEDIPERAAPELTKQIELYRREIPAAEERLAQGVDRQGESLGDDGKAALAGQIEAAKVKLAGLEEIKWALPTLTVVSSLALERETGPIEMRAAHAHTRGDLLLYLPKAKVLITGDVVDDVPYGGHGFPSDWVQVLRELEGEDWDILIPGHGPVRRGDDARRHLAAIRSHFEVVIAAAEKAAVSGATLEAAKEAFGESVASQSIRAELAGDDEVAQRNFDFMVPATFERAFLEARGELQD